MTLSARERYIAIAVAAAILLFALDRFMLEPYLSQREDVAKAKMDLQTRLNDANMLFARERKDRKIWTELQNGGLKVDASQAETQTFQAVNQWTASAGVKLDSLKSERTAQEGNFNVISYSIQGTGTSPQVTRLLWAMETATIPVRINDLQLSPKSEGTDTLTVRISISSLCQPPAQPAKVANASGSQS